MSWPLPAFPAIGVGLDAIEEPRKPSFRLTYGKVLGKHLDRKDEALQALRRALQVDPENAAEADHMFTTLMGEKVGPRKDFIRAEARKVQNLDV